MLDNDDNNAGDDDSIFVPSNTDDDSTTSFLTSSSNNDNNEPNTYNPGEPVKTSPESEQHHWITGVGNSHNDNAINNNADTNKNDDAINNNANTPNVTTNTIETHEPQTSTGVHKEPRRNTGFSTRNDPTENDWSASEPIDNKETEDKHVENINSRIGSLEHELSDHSNDTDSGDNNNISESISGYQESKDIIAVLKAEMDNQYRTRLRQNLRSWHARRTVPAKFCGMELASVEEIEEQLNAMSHKPLSLKDHANIYSAIHHSGIADADIYLIDDMVSTILTQYHISKGLKIYSEKGVDAVLKELRQLHNRMVI